jgi:hypothetical protein
MEPVERSGIGQDLCYFSESTWENYVGDIYYFIPQENGFLVVQYLL